MNGLLISRIVLFGIVALSFPLGAIVVFALGYDRHVVADGLSVAYGFGLITALSTAYWPLRCIQHWDRLRRAESLVLIYLGMSYITHLSWEFGWLVLHKSIALSQDAPWAYAWWAYIDGGDARYANPEIHLIVMEILSVTNGLCGSWALITFLRSGRTHQVALLVMLATAVVHLYSALLYYLTELLNGMPNVNTESFIGTYIKFGLANLPWVVVPWFVFWWANQKLRFAPDT
jgi:hypothetical protein